MNSATKKFIASHSEEDIFSLSLLKNVSTEVDMTLAVRQIKGLQKAKKKIPTFYACKALLYPKQISLEQSSSELTARYKAALIASGRMVDLTGGFGIDSYFFSQKAQKVIYVEQDEELCRLAKLNFSALGAKNIEIYHQSAENFLSTQVPVSFDYIFIDPDRRKETKRVFLLSDCSPNIIKLQKKILQIAPLVIIKLSPMIDISMLEKQLLHIAEIHILAVKNDCKEVLVIQHEKPTPNGSINIKAVNILNENEVSLFIFSNEEEKKAKVKYAQGIKHYLYEPNVAVTKAGAFKSVAAAFKIEKLHANTHLYTADNILTDFPGRTFEVKQILLYNKQTIRELKKHYPKANITTRNFPIKPTALRQKLQIADGGETTLFFTTDSENRKKVISCQKIPLKRR